MININNLPLSLHHIKENYIIVAVRIFFIVFIMEVLHAGFTYLFLFSNIGQPYQAYALPILFIAQLLKLIIQVYLVIFTTLSALKSDFYLSDDKIFCYRGIIWTNEDIYQINSIRSIKVHQSWLSKMLNYGNISIEMTASGGYHKVLLLQNISDPKKYEHTINELTKKSTNN